MSRLLKISKITAKDGGGDDDSGKCPVCLSPFTNQKIGTPECCDHAFCLECILEWSKNVNTCPVDRQNFNQILVLKSRQDRITRGTKRIAVEDRRLQNIFQDIENEVEETTYCEVCGSCDREDRLLLCDGCDAGYHCECLNPPIDVIPLENWYCPDCVPSMQDDENMAESLETDDEELSGLIDTETPDLTISRLRPRDNQLQSEGQNNNSDNNTSSSEEARATAAQSRRRRRPRSIPRTRFSERIRNRIARARAAVAAAAAAAEMNSMDIGDNYYASMEH